MIKNYLTEFLDFILPRFCPGCKNKLTSLERVVCTNCLSKLKPVEPDLIKTEYQRKFESKKIISGFISQYIFEKDKELQHIVHALKYDKKFLIGKFLGENLGKTFVARFKDWNINLIIPVPLHHLKKAERGFNQSYYIAKGISITTGITLDVKAVKRFRFTQSQTTMTLREREENIEGAFKVRKTENVKGKNVLLVDDVMTTGATISECGRVLLNAGANRIYAATVALADF
ncbi:MAG: ComF family protein [Ignavibacteriaceae bacterium]|nr:ComF family protein [Ignavibacteriaceae bacterium]